MSKVYGYGEIPEQHEDAVLEAMAEAVRAGGFGARVDRDRVVVTDGRRQLGYIEIEDCDGGGGTCKRVSRAGGVKAALRASAALKALLTEVAQ